MIINEVPEWLPTVNLVLRSLLLCLIVAYIIRRHARLGVGDAKWITLETLACVMAVILVAGSIFQAGWMGLGDWTLVGTWGSLLAAIVATLLIAWRD